MTSKRKDQILKLLKGIETGDPESVTERDWWVGPS